MNVGSNLAARILLPVCAVLCLLCNLQPAAIAQPKVILVLANHLSLTDLRSAAYISGLKSVPTPNASAWIDDLKPHTLVSPGLPDKHTPIETCYARMADSTLRPEFTEEGLVGSGMGAVDTTIIGTTSGDDTGSNNPIQNFITDPSSVSSPEQLDPLFPGGLRDNPETLRTSALKALATSDLVVVQWGDFDRIQQEESSHLLLPSLADAYRKQTLKSLGRFLLLLATQKQASLANDLTLVLASPVPPMDSHGGWNSLTPFIEVSLYAPSPVASYSSTTTQTPGLIAQRDIGPTLLALLQAPVDPGFTGAPAYPVSGPPVEIDTLDRLTRYNQIVETPFFWTMGVLLGFIGFAIVLTMRRPAGVSVLRRCGYGLRVIAVWPGAMLLACVIPTPNPVVYFALIYALIFIGAFLPSVSAILIGTSTVLLIDCMTGSHLISGSLFSAYTLSGIRFYGIGNEYMGVLIAGTLLGSQWICEKLSPNRETIRASSWRLPVLFVFAFVTLIMSCPSFGAKAGAALTCGVTFAAAYSLLGTGKTRLRHILGGLLAGALVLGFWIAASGLLGLRHTHLQGAYTAVGASKGQELWELTVSKLQLAFTVLTHPGTIIGGSALVVFGFTVQFLLRKPLQGYEKTHPSAMRLYSACLIGCAACILLNDSGVVAAILLFSMMTVSLLYGLVIERCELPPSTLEKSA